MFYHYNYQQSVTVVSTYKAIEEQILEIKQNKVVLNIFQTN